MGSPLEILLKYFLSFLPHLREAAQVVGGAGAFVAD
jgi:hypothetical protein